MKKNIALSAIIVFTVASLATYSAPSAMADWLIDSSGTLLKIDPSVLGDSDNSGSGNESGRDDDQGEDNDTDDSNDDQDEDEAETPESSATPDSNKLTEEQERLRELEKRQAERTREELKKQAEVRKEMLKKSGQKSEFRIKSQDGKIKVKSELKDVNGNLIRRAEAEIEGDEERFGIMGEDGKIMEIQEVSKNRLEITRERIKTKSELELKVGEKNEISVTLPSGKVREIKLPDIALAKLVENGVITQTDGEEESYILTAGANGEPIFSGVSGEVEKSLLGFKLKFRQKLNIAASDSEDGTVKAGDIVESISQETGWRRLLERLTL